MNRITPGVNGTPPAMLNTEAKMKRQHDAAQRDQLEADVLQQIVVDLAPHAHRFDDGGEVVVGQDHARGVLRHVGAGDAHRDADVRRFDARARR